MLGVVSATHRGPRSGPTYDVAILGTSPAALYLALTLVEGGVSNVALCQTRDYPLDLGVLWPGLTEHWGMLADTIGKPQTEALIRSIARSRDLVLAEPEARRGAVLQLASNPTEMQEMTHNLRWLSDLWPRRLMSAGSASNYVTVNDVAGAAFVGDCCSFEVENLTRRLFIRLQTKGVKVLPEPTREAEIVVDADPKGPGLFHQCGAEFLCAGMAEPWNPALVGIETQRGHLLIHPNSAGGWWISGVAPEGAGLEPPWRVDPKLVDILCHLAGQALSELEGLITSQARPLVYQCSADGLPLVGPLPGNPRCWTLGGFAGRSWSLGPALGEQVGRAILGEPTPLLDALPCLRPARWLR